MKTIRSLSYAGIGSVFLAFLSSNAHAADTSQSELTNGTSHSLVQRVGHSLAGANTYTSSPSGYKWGNKTLQHDDAKAQWASSAHDRGGYKWGDSSTRASTSESQSYAGTTSYQWGATNFSKESGYRWGMKNFADQAGYRWGMKNFSDQAGYRWGMKNFADQAGYRWGMKNFADQAGY
ncbi:MAG: hypothetical protein V7700_06190, partial [Halioglobus sp.]